MSVSSRRRIAGLTAACAILAFAAGIAPASAQMLKSGIGDGALSGRPLVTRTFGVAGECQPIDFNGVDIQFNRGQGVYQLTVTGIKRFANMEVSFSHQSYNGRPAYWRSMVVGCWKNLIVIPIPTPYYITMPLDQFVGTRGVEIVGATQSVRRNVPHT